MIFWKHLDKGWMPLPFTTCFLAVKENGSVTFTVGFWNGEAFEEISSEPPIKWEKEDVIAYISFDDAVEDFR